KSIAISLVVIRSCLVASVSKLLGPERTETKRWDLKLIEIREHRGNDEIQTNVRIARGRENGVKPRNSAALVRRHHARQGEHECGEFIRLWVTGMAQVLSYLFKNALKADLRVSRVVNPKSVLSDLSRFNRRRPKRQPRAFRVILRAMRREGYCRKR